MRWRRRREKSTVHSSSSSSSYIEAQPPLFREYAHHSSQCISGLRLRKIDRRPPGGELVSAGVVAHTFPRAYNRITLGASLSTRALSPSSSTAGTARITTTTTTTSSSSSSSSSSASDSIPEIFHRPQFTKPVEQKHAGERVGEEFGVLRRG